HCSDIAECPLLTQSRHRPVRRACIGSLTRFDRGQTFCVESSLTSKRRGITVVIAMFSGTNENTKWLRVCCLVAGCMTIAAPAVPRSAFDGDWSVVITTSGGGCPSAARSGSSSVEARGPGGPIYNYAPGYRAAPRRAY